MPFRNAVVGGLQLLREAIRSQNFLTGVSGWSINRDGSAEFSGALIRGDFQAGDDTGVKVVIDDAGIHMYILGNLAFDITSIADQAVGNWYNANNGDREQVLGWALTQLTGIEIYGGPNQRIEFTDGDAEDGAATNEPIRFLNGSSPVLAMPGGIIAYTNSSAANANTGTILKDVLGDLSFEVLLNRRYRIVYKGRASSTGIATTSLQIRDGGGSSPTTTSTLLQAAMASHYVANTPGAMDVVCERTFESGDLSVGTHTIAGFFTMVTGGPAVSVNQAPGGVRELIVYDEG